MEYTRLGLLVGSQFTINSVDGVRYIRFLDSKPEVSQTPKAGFAKEFILNTDKGILNLKEGQVGTILSKVIEGGVANLIGKTIKVGSNGQSGLEIRYYFDEVKPNTYRQDQEPDYPTEQPEINPEDIPF
jgi:hypothetical protein